ncbi:uncharacterized protein LOC118421864 [Branchiostoma floridae]|uniref:Uncharacterized protein LOC118421864 n=1 Tax=Branchiostoma floridae TaxID=7739 RepID=A0A9J7LNX6_BRAFL|nr:uncharacterized protein LOC118421864 [Branchiostoma floridae]
MYLTQKNNAFGHMTSGVCLSLSRRILLNSVGCRNTSQGRAPKSCKMAPKHPCTKCSKQCTLKEDCLKCTNCNLWSHGQCLGFATRVFKAWKAKNTGLCFLCPNCVGPETAFPGEPVRYCDRYKACDALARLGTVAGFPPSSVAFKQGVSNELLLQETYNVYMPERPLVVDHSNSHVDITATEVLKEFHPVMLRSHEPLRVAGDGNCLFRALSLGLFGKEDYHVLIRLLTALEIFSYQAYYDFKDPNNIDLVKDDRVEKPDYEKLLKTVTGVSDGGYSYQVTVYAASAALGVAIQTYLPPTGLNMELASDPHTRKVHGRGVRPTSDTAVTVMWTQAGFAKGHNFHADHFVVLKPRDAIDSYNLVSGPEDEEGSEPEVAPSLSFLSPGSQDSDPSPLPSPESISDESTTLTDLLEVMSNVGDEGDGSEGSVNLDMYDIDYPATPSEGSSDDDEDDTPVSTAAGGHSLPKPGTYLSSDDLFDILTDVEVTPLECIPPGQKQDCYFVFDNTANVQRQESHQTVRKCDDSGAWKSGGPTNRHVFVHVAGSRTTEVKLEDGLYGTVYRKRIRGGRRLPIFTALQPQPQPDQVFVLHRAYSYHTNSQEYKRRISWITQDNTELPKIAVAEYLGRFPGRKPHGRSRNINPREYLRTDPVLLDKVKSKAQFQPPKRIWQELYNKEMKLDGLSSTRQIVNAKHRETKKQQQTHGSYANFADHIQNVQSMTKTHGHFVRSVKVMSNKVPTVTLYTDQQIQDMKRFCCAAQPAQGAVLGFDKTFNLTKVHVTVGVFKHLAVKRRKTGNHPIFIGPMYLHDNSDMGTYYDFFAELSAKLHDAPSPPVLGSDDEGGLRNGMKKAFPMSCSLCCTRHLKENIKAQLVKIGVPEAEVKNIKKALFGKEGVSHSDDEKQFRSRIAKCRAYYMEHAPQFDTYFKRYVAQPMEDNFNTRVKCPWTASFGNWTNNNCESINSVLKRAVDRKTLSLTDLVVTLEKLVKSQYDDLRLALAGQGDLVLCQPYARFYKSIDVWTTMDTDSRNDHFAQFMKYKVDKSTSVSTDGRLRVTTPNSRGGKKPGQNKRNCCAKITVAMKFLLQLCAIPDSGPKSLDLGR